LNRIGKQKTRKEREKRNKKRREREGKERKKKLEGFVTTNLRFVLTLLSCSHAP
jgi:hypothetical protein